jgi:hypothetical protein
MSRIPEALQALCPGAEWHLLDVNDLKTLDWLDQKIPRPTDEQIEAAVAALPAKPFTSS